MKNRVFELIEEIREELDNYGRDSVVPMLRELEDITGVEGYLEDIVNTDLIDDLVESRLKDNGWQGVAYMLAKIDYLSDDYYRIDGYGNLVHLETSDLECMLDDMVREIDLEEYDEEEEEE